MRLAKKNNVKNNRWWIYEYVMRCIQHNLSQTISGRNLIKSRQVHSRFIEETKNMLICYYAQGMLYHSWSCVVTCNLVCRDLSILYVFNVSEICNLKALKKTNRSLVFRSKPCEIHISNEFRPPNLRASDYISICLSLFNMFVGIFSPHSIYYCSCCFQIVRSVPST